MPLNRPAEPNAETSARERQADWGATVWQNRREEMLALVRRLREHSRVAPPALKSDLWAAASEIEDAWLGWEALF